jgi:outer membrane protein assembly factor BamB
MTTRCRVAVALGLALLAGACASKPEPVAPPAPRAGSEAIDRDAYGKLGYSLAWSSYASFDTTRGARLQHVQPLGDVLAIQDDAASMTILSASSGQQRWAAAVGEPLTRYLGIARQGRNILAVAEGEVVRLDSESGAILARQRFERVASAGPVRLGDAVLMGTVSRVAFAHLLDNGLSAWAFTLSGPVSVKPAALGSDSIGYASDDGTLTILNPADGSLRGAGRMFGPPGSAPAAGDFAFYVGSMDQSLYAFDSRNGAQRWRVRCDAPLARPVVFQRGSVYTNLPGRGLLAVDSSTGATRWTAKDATGDVVAGNDKQVVTFDPATGVAQAIAARDGSVIATVTLGNVARLVASGPEGSGDLYAVSARGEVSKFIAK